MFSFQGIKEQKRISECELSEHVLSMGAMPNAPVQKPFAEANPAHYAVGIKMLEGRDVTGGALKWCQWGAADGTDDDQPDGQIAAATVAMIEKLGDTPW